MLGIFVDIGNQFYTVNRKWAGRKIDYSRYLALAKQSRATGDPDRRVRSAYAFGTQIDNSAVKFVSCLKHIGFTPVYRSIQQGTWYDWAVGITVELFRHHQKLDEVVLGSSNQTMVPVVNWLRENGIIVTIIACGISRELKEAADHWIEITEDLLEGYDADADST